MQRRYLATGALRRSLVSAALHLKRERSPKECVMTLKTCGSPLFTHCYLLAFTIFVMTAFGTACVPPKT